MDPLSKFRLDGKTAVIAGGTRGIGLAVAELFSAAGAGLALIGIAEENGERAVTRIAAQGGKAEFYQADLREPARARAVAEDIERDFGRIHVLVNSAGICHSTPI